MKRREFVSSTIAAGAAELNQLGGREPRSEEELGDARWRRLPQHRG